MEYKISILLNTLSEKLFELENLKTNGKKIKLQNEKKVALWILKKLEEKINELK